MATPHPLTQLIAACEPGTPAGDPTYVARERPVATRLLDAVLPTDRSRALLVGQTGVGKSTELHRIFDLDFAMNMKFFCMIIPIDTFVDLDTASWHDILVLSAAVCSDSARVRTRAVYANLEQALRPPAHRQLQVFGGPPDPTPEQRFRNNFSEVHRTIELGRAQFWDMAVSVLGAAAAAAPAAPLGGSCELVLIWDGLEKMSLASARRLFGDEGQYLQQLPFRVIVTAPLGLTFDESFGQIEEHFSYVERLRAVSVEPGGAGERFCLELLIRRGADPVCSHKLMKRAIAMSGGVPRQLLQIVSYAAKQALSDGQEQITLEALVRAGNQLAGKWQYQLGPKDYDALEKADEDREPSERARLLQLGACIEHDSPDGGLQIDVNPLVQTLLDKRAARAAERRGQRG
jgi:hypothetical protein